MTHIDLIPIISDEKVPQYPGLVQVTEANHVFHSPNGCRVHRLDPPLRSQPLLLPVIIDNLDSVSLRSGDDPGPQSNIKLPPGHWLNPDMVTLHTTDKERMKPISIFTNMNTWSPSLTFLEALGLGLDMLNSLVTNSLYIRVNVSTG